jgi:parvulin-like peptidyl-prolyl isomerase
MRLDQMARIRRFLYLPGLGAALILSGCGLNERLRSFLQGDRDSAAVVRVGDTTYARPDLEYFFDSRLSEFRDPTNVDSVKSNLLESFIEEKLLLHEAEKHGVKADPAMLKAAMEQMELPPGRERGKQTQEGASELGRAVSESLMMEQYLHDFLLNNVVVAEEDCEAYYSQHLEDYVSRDVVHVREILVDDLSQAERILSSLKANRNSNFGELARLYSKAATAEDGGDMGRFERGELPEEFEKVVFSLPPGTVSKIVRTKYGYHTFLVEERIRAHQQKLYEVRDQIQEKLLMTRQRGIIEQKLASLETQIPVSIYRERLGFNYVGTRFAPRGEDN